MCCCVLSSPCMPSRRHLSSISISPPNSGSTMLRGPMFPSDGRDSGTLPLGRPLAPPHPCVNCARPTSGFCSGLTLSNSTQSFAQLGSVVPLRRQCFARDWIPSAVWPDGLRTPHCIGCSCQFGRCHFCRDVPSCQPRPHSRYVRELLAWRRAYPDQVTPVDRSLWLPAIVARALFGSSGATLASPVHGSSDVFFDGSSDVDLRSLLLLGTRRR